MGYAAEQDRMFEKMQKFAPSSARRASGYHYNTQLKSDPRMAVKGNTFAKNGPTVDVTFEATGKSQKLEVPAYARNKSEGERKRAAIRHAQDNRTIKNKNARPVGNTPGETMHKAENVSGMALKNVRTAKLSGTIQNASINAENVEANSTTLNSTVSLATKAIQTANSVHGAKTTNAGPMAIQAHGSKLDNRWHVSHAQLTGDNKATAPVAAPEAPQLVIRQRRKPLELAA